MHGGGKVGATLITALSNWRVGHECLWLQWQLGSVLHKQWWMQLGEGWGPSSQVSECAKFHQLGAMRIEDRGNLAIGDHPDGQIIGRGR